MERIQTLLQKITDLHRGEKEKTVIDIDLMLDYTRVLYADLLEWRGKMQEMPLLSADHRPEPTQSEITAAIEQAHTEVAATNIMTAPSIELGQNVQHFEESEQDHKEPQSYILGGTAQPAARRAQDEFHRLIGINDKYQFISELFSNN
jgi:homoaconitase/3-isopropylmalate dehydratase large subunit